MQIQYPDCNSFIKSKEVLLSTLISKYLYCAFDCCLFVADSNIVGYCSSDSESSGIVAYCAKVCRGILLYY
jgi:hypothetical protein